MVECILAELSFDDLESMGTSVSLPLHSSERLHELSMRSNSFLHLLMIDMALKLCEMSSCCSAGAHGRRFAAAILQSLSQCHISPMPAPEVILEALVSLLRGRRVLRRGRRPCEYLLERLLAFDMKGGRTVLFACPARLIDKTGMDHNWPQHTIEFLHSFAFGCRCGNVSRLCVLPAHCSQP